MVRPIASDSRSLSCPALFCRQKKTLTGVPVRVFRIRAWRWPTLTWGDPTLPSARLRFTSEFGMGSGGSTALLSSSKPWCFVVVLMSTTDLRWLSSFRRLHYLANWVGHMIDFILVLILLLSLAYQLFWSYNTNRSFRLISYSIRSEFWCYMVKPHGQLVQVSSTPHNAYTPCLSTR